MLTVPLGAPGVAALAPGLPPEAAAVAGAPLRPLHAAPAIATMANRAARRASGVVVLLLTVSPSCSADASVRDGPSSPAPVSTARDLPEAHHSGAPRRPIRSVPRIMRHSARRAGGVSRAVV